MSSRRPACCSLLAMLLGLFSCAERNPESCLNTPSVCTLGTGCVKGTDKQGRVWSACVPYDGGAEVASVEDAGSPLGGIDAPVDAPRVQDTSLSSTDVGSADSGDDPDAGGRGAGVCSDGTSRSCAMDGLLGNCAKGTEACASARWGICSVSAQIADRWT